MRSRVVTGLRCRLLTLAILQVHIRPARRNPHFILQPLSTESTFPEMPGDVRASSDARTDSRSETPEFHSLQIPPPDWPLGFEIPPGQTLSPPLDQFLDTVQDFLHLLRCTHAQRTWHAVMIFRSAFSCSSDLRVEEQISGRSNRATIPNMVKHCQFRLQSESHANARTAAALRSRVCRAFGPLSVLRNRLPSRRTDSVRRSEGRSSVPRRTDSGPGSSSGTGSCCE